MNLDVASDSTLRESLAEAARWRLAGLLFRRPRPGWREELRNLSREVGDPRLAAAVASTTEASEGAYLGWCGPGGPVSPREVSYRPLEDPGRLLAEIAAFHESFAYRMAADEPRDHVAVAADFTAYLALKEAFAVAAGRANDAATVREARASFVERHVAPLARGIGRRLDRSGDAPAWLAEAAAALQALAGVRLDAGGDTEGCEDGGFLLPGLDRAVFGCGLVDAGDGTFSCDPRCPGSASGEDSGPVQRGHPDIAEGTTRGEKT